MESAEISALRNPVAGRAMHHTLMVLGLVACVAAITLGGCSEGTPIPEATSTSTPQPALPPIKFAALPHPSGPSTCQDGYVSPYSLVTEFALVAVFGVGIVLLKRSFGRRDGGRGNSKT